MARNHGKRQAQRGAALIFALTLLTLFAVLGTSYVVSMSLELEAADLRIRETRAALLAEAGIHAAIGDLALAVREGRQGDFLSQREKTYTFPAYKGVMTREGYVLDQEPRISHAAVVCTDESGKLNLNHAPASMLRLVLNIDGATARNITTSLPLPTIFQPVPSPGRQWFAGPDELLTRELLTPEQFASVDASLLTVASVADHKKPERFLNVNTAPAEVLAALVDIPIEEAKQAMLKRPFKSLAEIEAATGKAAETFNIRPKAGAPDSLPDELSLESRCFRLVSTGTFGMEGQGIARRSSGNVEAVVVFNGDGTYTITHWATGAVESDETTPEPEAVAEETGEETATPVAPEATTTTDETANQAG